MLYWWALYDTREDKARIWLMMQDDNHQNCPMNDTSWFRSNKWKALFPLGVDRVRTTGVKHAPVTRVLGELKFSFRETPPNKRLVVSTVQIKARSDPSCVWFHVALRLGSDSGTRISDGFSNFINQIFLCHETTDRIFQLTSAVAWLLFCHEESRT